MSEPYIGVTGFMRRSEVERVLSAPTIRPIMIGILVSDKTLRGEQNRWPGRYPAPEKFPYIFVKRPRTINLLHLHVGEEERGKLLEYMLKAHEIAGVLCEGFQLNVAWPNREMLAEYKSAPFPRKTIVLQVGRRALNECGGVEECAQRVQTYEGLIEHVLYDQSGGRAGDINLEEAVQFCRAIKRVSPRMGIAVAGGFTPENVVPRIETIRKGLHDPFFSVDAEGGMRNPVGDTLDVEKAVDFVDKADWAFSQ